MANKSSYSGMWKEEATKLRSMAADVREKGSISLKQMDDVTDISMVLYDSMEKHMAVTQLFADTPEGFAEWCEHMAQELEKKE